MCNFEKKIFGFSIKNIIYTVGFICVTATWTWANLTGNVADNRAELARHIEQSNNLIKEFKRSQEKQDNRLALLEKTMIETRVDIKYVREDMSEVKEMVFYLKKKKNKDT